MSNTLPKADSEFTTGTRPKQPKRKESSPFATNFQWLLLLVSGGIHAMNGFALSLFKNGGEINGYSEYWNTMMIYQRGFPFKKMEGNSA